MDSKINTPRTVCKAIVAVAIAAIAVAAIIGCSSLGGGSRKANIATVIQTAYDMGGREAVSNKIESLVAEGKLTPSQEYPPSEASAAGGSMRGVATPVFLLILLFSMLKQSCNSCLKRNLKGIEYERL